MTKKKKSSSKWFIAVRGSYLPASTHGWVSYVPFVAYLVGSAFLTKNINASVAARAYFIIVQWFFAGLIMTWIAKHRS